jgi:hypothetical protein
MSFVRILHDGFVAPSTTELYTGRQYLHIHADCSNYSRRPIYYGYVIQIYWSSRWHSG